MKKLVLLSLLCITTTIVSNPDFIEEMKRALYHYITMGDNYAQVHAFQSKALEGRLGLEGLVGGLKRLTKFVEELLTVLEPDGRDRANKILQEMKNTVATVESRIPKLPHSTYAKGPFDF